MVSFLHHKSIDTSLDLTTDLLGYWDGFGERNSGLGTRGPDPDNAVQYYKNTTKSITVNRCQTVRYWIFEQGADRII